MYSRSLVGVAGRRALVACDRGQVLVPAGDGHVELVLVGEVDGAHCATGRRRTQTAARHDVRVAPELLAIRGKSRRVLVERRRDVDARLQRVDDVLTCPCGVGTRA